MKFALVIVFLMCIYGIRAEVEKIKQGDIAQFKQLNTNEWEQLLKENDNVIVLTTPNIENLLVVYDQVTAMLEQLLDPKTNSDLEILAFKVFQFNCTNDREFCLNNRIYNGSITWFYKGNWWSNAGISPQWTPDALNYWVNLNVVHDVRDISDSFKQVTTCPIDDDFIVVLFDENNEEKNIFDLLKLKLAIKAPDASFYKVTDANLVKQEAEDRKSPFVKVYQCGQPEEPSFFINFNDSTGSISNLITAKSFPKVRRLSNPTMKHAFENFNLTLIVGIEEDYQTDELFAWLAKVNSAAILWEHASLLQGFAGAGCTGLVWPTAVAVVDNGQKPLSFNEKLEFNLENVQKWIDNINAGNRESFKKSRKVDPAENALKTLPEISYEEFEETVLKSSDPIVVAFTASRDGCGGGYCISVVGGLEKVKEYYDYTFPDFPIKIYNYDTDYNFHVRPEFGVPAVVIFDKGTEIEYENPRRLKFHLVRDWINEVFSLTDPHDEL